MAKCSKCGNKEQLYVYYIPDPHSGYPIDPELICERCPPPDNVYKDAKTEYNGDLFDQMLGLKDYQVDFAYRFCSIRNEGLCFECDKEIDMENGYGHCYVPHEYWLLTEHTSVIYCRECYRKRCENHLDFTLKEELLKLEKKLPLYRVKTLNGVLV